MNWLIFFANLTIEESKLFVEELEFIAPKPKCFI